MGHFCGILKPGNGEGDITMIRNLEPGGPGSGVDGVADSQPAGPPLSPCRFLAPAPGGGFGQPWGREEVYVAVEQGKVVGVYRAAPGLGPGAVLLPEWQGRGIGQQLLGRIKQQRSQLWLQGVPQKPAGPGILSAGRISDFPAQPGPGQRRSAADFGLAAVTPSTGPFPKPPEKGLILQTFCEGSLQNRKSVLY